MTGIGIITRMLYLFRLPFGLTVLFGITATCAGQQRGWSSRHPFFGMMTVCAGQIAQESVYLTG